MVSVKGASGKMHSSRSLLAPSVEGRGICKSFATGNIQTQVLREFTIGVFPGELTLISGPSGCGKSTLLSILSGLQSCDDGHVRALGQDLSQLSSRALETFRLKHTGFVFQGFNLFPALTASEQVELPLGYLGLPRRECRQRAHQALDEVGLSSRRDLRPAALSGGEKQRVAVARALAKRPQLLFADEPTSALDAASGQNVVDLLRRIADEYGTTVLCVSHDPRVVRHAERVLAMEDGRIQRDWRPGQSGAEAEQATGTGQGSWSW